MVGYLERRLPEETFKALANAKPRPKVTSLVDLIEQAQKRTATGD